jgi:serine/threonine protein kinase
VTPRGRIQLADFGSAICLSIAKEGQYHLPSSTNQQSSQGQDREDRVTLLGGTVDYASPEILRGTSISKLTVSTDLWSLGAIFHSLLTGSSPFHAASDALALQKVMDYANGCADIFLDDQNESHNAYSQEWKDLILGLLNPISEERLGSTTGGASGSPSISALIPGFESIDLEAEPAFLPPEPKWVNEARETEMRDGSKGWSSFLT